MAPRLTRVARRARGLTLLEVMVAVAILGLTLTVIISAQTGLASSNRSSAHMGFATSLGRCRMTELEEKLLKEGYPEIDQLDTDQACCDGEKDARFLCDHRVEKVELPNLIEGGDAGALPGMLNNPGGGPGLNLATGDGGLQNLGQQVQGQLGVAGMAGAGAGGASGLLSMVMGIVYPSMKPMYEASIRKVTVTVKWKEGPNEHELALVQYVTSPQRSGMAGSALMADGGTMDFGPAGAAAGTGTGAGKGGTTGTGSGTGSGTGGTR
jgi:general secretion pathway protein I